MCLAKQLEGGEGGGVPLWAMQPTHGCTSVTGWKYSTQLTAFELVSMLTLGVIPASGW